jgi:hypothetical protein
MVRKSWSVMLVVAIGSLLFIAADTTRNPFGIPDIDDPTGDDVLAHYDRAPLDAGDKDPNAAAWPAEVVEGDPMKFDGAWSGRWNSLGGDTWYNSGETKIAKRGDRLFILQGAWYIEAIRQRDGRYAGRWVSAGNTSGGGTWVGRIVDDERIDGDWASGRWDFRRRFK